MASGEVHLQTDSADPCCSSDTQAEENCVNTNVFGISDNENNKGTCDMSKDDVLIMHENMTLDWNSIEKSSSVSTAADVPVFQNKVQVNGLKPNSSNNSGQNLNSRPIQVNAKGWSLSAENQVPAEKPATGSSYSYNSKHGKFQQSSPKSYQRASSNKHYSFDSPCQLSSGSGGPMSGTGEHVVLLHVNPGETISFFMGDHTQLIQGPATVRMVSCNSTPPMPLPVQVPPGHMVQQIVDENGTLRHIILSPQPPLAVPVGTPYSATSSTGSPSSASRGGGGGGAGGGPSPFFVYPHHSYPPPMQFHTHLQPGLTNISSHGGHVQHSCSSGNSQGGSSQGQYPSMSSQVNMSKDERTQKQFFKLKKRLEARQKDGSSTARSEFMPRNDAQRSPASFDVQSSQQTCSFDQSKMYDFLSAVEKPDISDVTARSALASWSAPILPVDSSDMHSDFNAENILYKILVSDKGAESPKKVVYCGKDLHFCLCDLKPGSFYSVCVQASLEDVWGRSSECSTFRTLACKPEQPQPPKLLSRTKTSLFLKWNAAVDNGSKITSYILEYDEGLGGDSFVEIATGLQKQFKVTKLKASTCYRFRLAAVNEFGTSNYSENACFSTSGSAPSQPLPPELLQAASSTLSLRWEARPNDDSFTLQMEEEGSLHGFLPVFNGRETSYTCTGLGRNTQYKFRLCANNEEGSSPWSQTVTFMTLPEPPSSPGRPYLKGHVHSTYFKVAWEPPKDSGGTAVKQYDLEVDRGYGFECVYSGPELEYQCDNLNPATMYFLRVKCLSEGGTSLYSDLCAIQTSAVAPGVCQPPRLVEKPKASTVHIKWVSPEYDGGSEVFEYEVEVQNPDGSSRQVYKGTGTDCVVAALYPGKQYSFCVRACNKIGHGPWSESLQVMTGAGSPDVPNGLKAVPRSPHSVFVSWDEPADNGAAITEYRLESCQSENFQLVYVGNRACSEIRNLNPATSYVFRVQAVNSAGASAFSESVRCQTPSTTPGSISLSNVKIVSTSSSITMTWKEPNDHGSAITSYRIEVGDSIITSSDIPEVSIEGLSPESAYRVRIQAVNSIGLGPFTSFKVTTRGLPPSPPALECYGYSYNSLRLKWGDGKNPEFIHYTLEMLNSHSGSFTPVYQGTGHSCKVSRLEEMTPYSFRIYATNAEGDGPYSSVYVFCTLKAVPPVPKAPKVSSVSETSCLVEWLPVKSIGNDMMSYKLQIGSKGLDYDVVYTGIQTSFSVQSLHPGTEYSVRVAAVRHCSDDSGDVCSPYSPSSSFCTLSLHSHASHARSTSVIANWSEHEPLSDQQWAVIILCSFTVLAVLIAMLIHWFLPAF